MITDKASSFLHYYAKAGVHKMDIFQLGNRTVSLPLQ